ncbi:T9SS type A sorting domain-containing protein [candidate division KSB1 bacterium]|nr:T9SS type A sorting domain-containing protein [candidate division KSB1 bacterium]
MKKNILLLLLVLSVHSPASELVTTPWEMPLQLKNERIKATLAFGTHPEATDSFDIALDGLAPPPAPASIWAYFQGKGIFSALTRDIRSNQDSLILWQVNISGLEDSLLLQWDSSVIPSGDINPELTLADSIDMLIDSTGVIRQNTTLNIQYKPGRQFARGRYLVSTKPLSVPFFVDGQHYDQPTVFDWVYSSRHIIEAMDSVLFDGCKQYRFTAWNQYPEPKLDVTVTDTDSVFCAIYDSLYFLSTAVSPANAGTIDPSPPGLWVRAGDNITLVAKADSGWGFKEWSTGHISNEMTLLVNTCSEWIAHFASVSALIPADNRAPVSFALFPNYPNPFNQSTRIQFSVPRLSPVTIVICNQLGEIIKTLWDRQTAAGFYKMIWNGRDEGGQPVASGLYIMVLTAEHQKQTQKLIYLK